MNEISALTGYNGLVRGNLREIIEMKIKDKIKKKKQSKVESKKQSKEAAAETNETESKKPKEVGQSVLKFIREVAVNIVTTGVIALIVAVWAVISGVYSNIRSIPSLATKEDISQMVKTSDIEDMATTDDIKNIATKDDISDMATKKDIEGLQTRISSLETLYNDLNRSVGKLEGALDVVFQPNEYVKNEIGQTYDSYNSAYKKSEGTVWRPYVKVMGNDFKTGDPYTVEDVENKTMVVSYFDENNDEIFFKGRFNEDNKWDGNCVINKYRDGNLIFIMNANYRAGKLETYNQVFSYTNASNKEVWAISSREVGEEGNLGETRTYDKEGEWKKDFDNRYLQSECIFDEKDFYGMMDSKMDLKLEGYYNGYTSDGYFNDTNENAYMVKYTEDGYVRTFYLGQFKDGQPYDLTGEAFAISLGYDGKNYYYYCGIIEDLSKISDIEDGWQPISVEEIEQKINADDYICSLDWFSEEIAQ